MEKTDSQRSFQVLCLMCTFLFENLTFIVKFLISASLVIILWQVTDYAIARRIVDLHCHLEESVNRVYSAEDIQRYITFARQFKPRVGDILMIIIIIAVIIACFTNVISMCR